MSEPAWHTPPRQRTAEQREEVFAALSQAEQERVGRFQGFRAALVDALAAGKRTVTMELPILEWLELLDEVQDRPPRNMSQLLRDDSIDRMHEVIDRLHGEAIMLIAAGPRHSVAAAFDEQPPAPPPRPAPPAPSAGRSKYKPSPAIRASPELEQRMTLDRLAQTPPRTASTGETTYGDREREPGEDG